MTDTRWADRVQQLGPGWRAAGIVGVADALAESVEAPDVIAWAPGFIDTTVALIAATVDAIVVAVKGEPVRSVQWAAIDNVDFSVRPDVRVVFSGRAIARLSLLKAPEKMAAALAAAAMGLVAAV